MTTLSRSTVLGGAALIALALSSSTSPAQAQTVKLAKSYVGADFEDDFGESALLFSFVLRAVSRLPLFRIETTFQLSLSLTSLPFLVSSQTSSPTTTLRTAMSTMFPNPSPKLPTSSLRRLPPSSCRSIRPLLSRRGGEGIQSGSSARMSLGMEFTCWM